MKTIPAWILLGLTLAAAALAGAAWHRTRVQLNEMRMVQLAPIVALLNEDQKLLGALQADNALAQDSGILTSYLAKMRADGLPKHADMKQRLDALAENNSAIVALINVYSRHARTAAFNAEADKFRTYAIAWRDRWNSVMELFMAGGNYSVAEVPFPSAFAAAIEAEIAAAK